MSRLVIVHIPEEVADVVVGAIRKASRAEKFGHVALALDDIADAVSTATNIDSEVHVSVGFNDSGKPLQIPDGDVIPGRPVFRALRDAVGGNAEVVRLTIVAEGRATR